VSVLQTDVQEKVNNGKAYDKSIIIIICEQGNDRKIPTISLFI